VSTGADQAHPGASSQLDIRESPEKEPIPDEVFIKRALGVGVAVEGEFLPAERAVVEEMSVFWMGCMH
jgi:hypothetical protein